jgi:hypothetical protein
MPHSTRDMRPSGCGARWTAPLILATTLLVAGCSTDFAQEMEIKPGEKTRPLGIICEPAEAVPGETVQVTARYYDPDAAAAASSWRLALDYRLDRYYELEYEGPPIDLEPLMQESRTDVDDDGIVTQTFRFAVPDSCLLVSSAVPEVIATDLPPAIAELLQPAGPYPTKQEVDAFLASVDTTALSPDELAWLQFYGDLFACQIRLRCTLRGGTPLSITRNLTVRYSRRLGSHNENLNPFITAIALIDVRSSDVDDKNDIHNFESDTTFVYHSDPSVPVERTIEVQSGHTYFLETRDEKQSYVSPAGLRHDEQYEYFWYYTRHHSAQDDLFFIKQDDGSENSDMGPKDEIVRIEPPPSSLGPQRYLLHLVVRDLRPEWRMYQATPGTAYAGVELLFAPATP